MVAEDNFHSDYPFVERRKSKIKRRLYALFMWGLVDLDFRTLVNRILILEILAVFGIVLVSWINEIFDLPHLVYGEIKTIPNYFECAIETGWALLVLIFVLSITKAFLKRIRHLEGFLPVCSFCKSIRVKEQWEPLERFMHQRTQIQMTHSLCPTCAKEHYGLTDEEIENFDG